MSDGWVHALRLTRYVLGCGPRTFMPDRRTILDHAGIRGAVQRGQTAPLSDWLMSAMSLQGISNAAALTFELRHGSCSLDHITRTLASVQLCPRPRSYWHFSGCRFRKETGLCAEPDLQPLCFIPRLPSRKGALAVGVTALALFIRDVAEGDLIGWFDRRLADADAHGLGNARGAALAASVAGPVAEISGIGPKVANMLLGDLLLAADPFRERWITAGASMIAVDTLVHAWMHRTGILSRLDADHAYGPACYDLGGCADIIEGLARRIDARTCDPEAPSYCPRLVQQAIWHFCAEGGANVCNGRRIDDRRSCAQRFCPAGPHCDRVALNS